MTDYFGEKTHQVIPESLIAFGMDISSRYGKAQELIQMIQFAQEACKQGVSNYVKSVFYDSKAGICTFELDPAVKAGDRVAEALWRAAKKTISQFDMLGSVGHNYDDPDES